MFSKKQGQRLIPEYLLKYTEKLNENHPDPSASWGGGSGSYTAGDGIDITNDVISVDDTVAMKTDIPDTTNFVTTNTNQTISGIKTLEGNANNVILKIDDTTPGSYDQLKFTPENMIVQGNLGSTTSYGKDGVVVSGGSNEFEITYVGTNKTYTFDDSKGGVVATTDEIITSYNDLTDKPTIPDMSNYYDKDEVDALISNVDNVDYTDDTLVLTDGTNNFEVSEPLIVEQKTNTITWTGFYQYDCYLDITNMPTGFRLVDDNGVDITTLHTVVYSTSDSTIPTFASLPTYAQKFELYQDNPYYITDDETRLLVNSISRTNTTTFTIWFNTSGTDIGGVISLVLTLDTNFTFRYDDWKPFDTTDITSGNVLYANCIELGNSNNNSRLVFKGFQTGTNVSTFILSTQQIMVYTNDGSTPVSNATITNYTSTSPYATMSDSYTFDTRRSYTNYSSISIASRSNDVPIPNEYKITCDLPQVPTRTTLYSSDSLSVTTTAVSILDVGKTLSDYDEIQIYGRAFTYTFNVVVRDTYTYGTLIGTATYGSPITNYKINIVSNYTNNTLTIAHNTSGTLTGWIRVIGINY